MTEQGIPEQSTEKLIPTTVGEALNRCAQELDTSELFYGHGTDNPWDEAVQLVLSVVELPLDSGDGVLPHPLTDADWQRISTLLRRRIEQRVPLPYLLGRAWFAGLEFRCDQRAIIPRSPIAELLPQAFQPWYRGPAPSRVLDLCCGGGCIGLATAHYLPEAHVDMVDLDPEALSLARENTELFQLQGRVTCIQSDLFQALGDERYDVILSNPPYVDASDLATMPAEYSHEPELALGSGANGLLLTHKLLATARQYLKPHGLLVVEVGNSYPALEQAYPRVPFTWLEFEQGGHGVFALSAKELQDYAESWHG